MRINEVPLLAATASNRYGSDQFPPRHPLTRWAAGFYHTPP
jgi:hypothetical protein